MIAYLQGSELKRPQVVASPPRKVGEDTGLVRPSFDRGTLFLKSTKGEHYRLEWPGGRDDPRRALPAGTYTLTSYRIARDDAKGITWFLSATAPAIRRLTIRAGEEQHLKFNEAIHLTGNARSIGGEVRVHCKLAGDDEAGLSVYRDGRRIDIDYRLIDAQDKELARGAMTYG